MSKRTVVEWSPHDASLFAVGADTLRLFEVTTSSSIARNLLDATAAPAALTTQRKRAFRVVRINAKVSHLKCLQWYPFESKPLLIATGTGSGKVLLCDFEDPRARVMREFLPKYSRPCHAVAWNPSVANQLAAGFEKVRSDFCTLVWDLNTSTAGSTGSQAMPRSSSSSTLEGLVEADGSALTGRKGGSTTGNSSIGGGGNNGYGVLDSKPVYELANSEATMALSWVPLQPTCLATGTGFKWLRVYDLRAKHSSPMSVVAHNKAVLGVVFDLHRPHMLATYSDAPQEPVKVWDLRRLDSASGPLVSLYQTSKTLAQVSWCPARAGILVTASTDEKWVSLWDVTQQESSSSILKKPFRRRYTSEPLTSFSWQQIDIVSTKGPQEAKESQPSCAVENQLAAAAFPNRMLTASITGEVGDISVHGAMPLAISSHGAIVFGCGKLLFGGAIHGLGMGTFAMTHQSLEPHTTRRDDDSSAEMYRLARRGYALDISTNLTLFDESTPRGRQVRDLWLWVDQVETLGRLRASQAATTGLGTNAVAAAGRTGLLRGWPTAPNTLVVAGVKHLLRVSGEASSTSQLGSPATAQEDSREEEPKETTVESVMKTDVVLGCPYFEGLGRQLSLLACNWDPESRDPSHGSVGTTRLDQSGARHIHRSSSTTWPAALNSRDDTTIQKDIDPYALRTMLAQCQGDGAYARGAALAVFHGDLHAAVALLQTGATALMHAPPLHDDHWPGYTPDVLQLVAMSVAGYSASRASLDGWSLWSSTTHHLLLRREITSRAAPRYFHALLTFLCVASATVHADDRPVGFSPSSLRPPSRRRPERSSDSVRPRPGAYVAILSDTTLPFRDRLAFACRYLPADELLAFVAQQEDASTQMGQLDGLVVTGLTCDGRRILQTYVDRTGDLQTLALVAARLPSRSRGNTSQWTQWIDSYTDLLNQWQLFHERARFDVARAQFAAPVPRDRQGIAPQRVAPQLFVRCNFCHASLSLAGLLRLGGSHASWLNRAKPQLTCCPTCRKPLPQCALCLLPLGSLNPYFELAHRRSRQTADAVQTMVLRATHGGGWADPPMSKNEDDSLAQLSSLPFVEWFTWCQSCKHGGHAHHVATWFQTHSQCPVTDCQCLCQRLDLPLVLDAQAQQMELHRSALQTGKHEHQTKAQSQRKERARDKTGGDPHPLQGVMGSHSVRQGSASSTMGLGATYRMHSSAQLRPSGSSSGYPPPFSLSGSNSMANLT